MQRVVTISLDGHIFPLEEGAFEALGRWLEQARALLAQAADREAILRDLERAVAQQCQHQLEHGGELISTQQMQGILSGLGDPQSTLRAIRQGGARRGAGRARARGRWHERWLRSGHGQGWSAPSRADARSLALLGGVVAPLASLAHAALLIALLVALAQLVVRGVVFGWPVPENLPLWAAALLLFAIYYVIATPLRVVRHGTLLSSRAGADAWTALWSTLLWVVLVALCLWLAWRFWPLLQRLLQELIDSVRGPPAGARAIVWRAASFLLPGTSLPQG